MGTRRDLALYGPPDDLSALSDADLRYLAARYPTARDRVDAERARRTP